MFFIRKKNIYYIYYINNNYAVNRIHLTVSEAETQKSQI